MIVDMPPVFWGIFSILAMRGSIAVTEDAIARQCVISRLSGELSDQCTDERHTTERRKEPAQRKKRKPMEESGLPGFDYFDNMEDFGTGHEWDNLYPISSYDDMDLNSNKDYQDVNANNDHVKIPGEIISLHGSSSLPRETLLMDGKHVQAHSSDIELLIGKIKRVLKEYEVDAEVTGYSHGPAVTMFEITPADGVKIKAVTELKDEFKMALAATQIRIEAPIPGKSAIGIEIPNKQIETVYLKQIINTDEFHNSDALLPVAMGKDLNGNAIVKDIAKMPHVLIAGATGSGKSVCINTIILSILYKKRPDEVKMILIDPKAVELCIYNGLPHLQRPVISDPQKATEALAWACVEMDNRFKKMSEIGARNITGYNERMRDIGGEKMPAILIVIDELADLMMTTGKDAEAYICRIAQKARACGIHLVVATQRPTVNVVTGLIKANMPCRIAFAVTSATDSKVILDRSGAECLLGKGDMLFLPQDQPNPVRIQGAFVSDEECETVVDDIKNRNPISFDVEPRKTARQELDENYEKKNEADNLMNTAREVAMKRGRVTISAIQMELGISSFSEAAEMRNKMVRSGLLKDDYTLAFK